jgi:hypothetical protein
MKQLLFGVLFLIELASCNGGSASHQPTVGDSATKGLDKVRPRVQQPVAAQQRSIMRVDSLNPVTPQPEQPTAAPPSRPLLAIERAQVVKHLNQRRLALNATGAKLRQDSIWLRKQLALPLPVTEQARYKLLLKSQRQRTAAYLRNLNTYRQSMMAFRQGRLLLDEARRLGVE